MIQRFSLKELLKDEEVSSLEAINLKYQRLLYLGDVLFSPRTFRMSQAEDELLVNKVGELINTTIEHEDRREFLAIEIKSLISIRGNIPPQKEVWDYRYMEGDTKVKPTTYTGSNLMFLFTDKELLELVKIFKNLMMSDRDDSLRMGEDSYIINIL